jgi:hypothetical protein
LFHSRWKETTGPHVLLHDVVRSWAQKVVGKPNKWFWHLMSWPSSFLCIRCIHSAPDFSEQISPFFINPFLFCYSPFVSSFLFENSDVVRF